MEFLITLCARGGSKGIPGKNVRILNGKPLLAYSIDAAKQFANHFNADITLSTDGEDIKKVAAEFGLSTEYIRPAQTATDTAGKLEAITDVLLYEEKVRGKKYDFLLDLDVTSPLRTIEDLLSAFSLFENDAQALNLFSVNPANRNPYFNMVEAGEDGYYHLIKKLPGHILSRQAAPKVYDLNASFYFYRRTFFEQGLKSALTDRSLIYIMPHICFDLDHPIDFSFLSYLLENKELDFSI